MSKNIEMVDVTIHLNEDLSASQRDSVSEAVRAQDGVMGIGFHDTKPHLMIVEFDPGKLTSADLLKTVQAKGVHAQVIGL